MLVVRDFSHTQTKWVYWKANSTATAYDDYPSQAPYPDVSSLLGKLQIIKVIEGSGTSYTPLKDSLWIKVGDDISLCDNLSGRRGEWDISTKRDMLEAFLGISSDGASIIIDPDALYTLAQDENGNIVSEPTLDGSVIAIFNGDAVVFQTSLEYDFSNLQQAVSSEMLSPIQAIDIVPGDMSTPDRFWTRNSNNEIIPL